METEEGGSSEGGGREGGGRDILVHECTGMNVCMQCGN